MFEVCHELVIISANLCKLTCESLNYLSFGNSSSDRNNYNIYIYIYIYIYIGREGGREIFVIY